MSMDWTVVRVVGTEEEAELLAGFLRSRDVPTEVESLLFHQEPVTFGRLGEVRIRVPADRQAEAERLLAEGAGEALEAEFAESSEGDDAESADSGEHDS